MVDVGELSGAVIPYLAAAAAAYGGAVVQRTADGAVDVAADATASIGRRLLRRLLDSQNSSQVRDAVSLLGEQPGSEAFAELVQIQVRRLLTDDVRLASDLTKLLSGSSASPAAAVTISGSQGVQIGDRNVQRNVFGT